MQIYLPVGITACGCRQNAIYLPREDGDKMQVQNIVFKYSAVTSTYSKTTSVPLVISIRVASGISR